MVYVTTRTPALRLLGGRRVPDTDGARLRFEAPGGSGVTLELGADELRELAAEALRLAAQIDGRNSR